jgi:predicted DNA-binding transcriptional regulator YafY
MAERKSARLLELLSLLLTRRYGVTLEEIRQVRGYPRNGEAFHRQFERDKELLRELGFAVLAREDADDASGTTYFLDRRRSFLREVRFTPEELAALALARRLTAHLPLVGAAVREGLSRAGEPAIEEWEPSGVTSVAPPAVGRRDEKRLRTIERAVASDRRLCIRYQPIGEVRAVAREVDPYALYLQGGAWYLLAYCHLRQSPRVFRVSRIEDARLATQGRGPDFTLPRNFDLARYLDRFPFEMGPAATRETTVRFSPAQAWRVGTGIGRRGRVARDPDGAVRVTLRNVNPDGLVSWALGLGRGVEILEPRALRRELARAAERVAEAHARAGTALRRRRAARS